MDARALADALKRRALEAGADLAGLAPAAALPEAAAYDAWVASGSHASMSYMERNAESRRDIRAWYPEAKTVLLCAFSYSDGSGPAAAPGQGRIARYAALPDYHDELKRRMHEIAAWLKAERPGADARVFVDTSPLLERLYARYAGLGWIGKNAMLVSPKKGSYLLLAGAALNVELPPDEPVLDHCGTCTRCLDACPTDAFPRERVLDASKCVAYFTIEHKGAIPEGFRAGVGDWVLGCDVCQEVCPWNRFAERGPAFPPPSETSLDLVALAELDAQGYKSRFKGTPVERPRRKGLARNALLAMGNAPEERFRPVLEKHAAGEDPVLAEQARWSLERLDRR